MKAFWKAIGLLFAGLLLLGLCVGDKKSEQASGDAKPTGPSPAEAAKAKTLARDLETAKAALAAERSRPKGKRDHKSAMEDVTPERLLEICGARPVVSEWDGEVVGLERELRKSAHDPDSIDVENCTPPRLSATTCWMFECQVRGKNMLGAKILNRMAFSKSALGFIDVTEK